MKKKNRLPIISSALLCGIIFMNLSIDSNLNKFETESINLSIIAKTATASAADYDVFCKENGAYNCSPTGSKECNGDDC